MNDGIDFVRAGLIGQTPVNTPAWNPLIARCSDATLREALARMGGLDLNGSRIKKIECELRRRERARRVAA